MAEERLRKRWTTPFSSVISANEELLVAVLGFCPGAAELVAEKGWGKSSTVWIWSMYIIFSIVFRLSFFGGILVL